MNAKPKDFDRLARVYRALEFVAFGRDLERARFCFLERWRDCRSILMLGEGDGRALARVLTLAPAARIHYVDASAAMLEVAAARLRRPEDRARVRFERADVFALALEPAEYDGISTLFFLDCFTPEQVETIVGRVRGGLQPQAVWLQADFALPRRGIGRIRARLWLGVLYAFFRWQTGLRARALPDSEGILERAGFRREAVCEFQGGLLRSAVFSQPGSRTCSS